MEALPDIESTTNTSVLIMRDKGPREMCVKLCIMVDVTRVPHLKRDALSAQCLDLASRAIFEAQE